MTTNVDVTRESDDYRQGYLALSHRIERFNRRICMERKKKKKKKEEISQGAEYTSRKKEHLKLSIEFKKDSHLVPLCNKTGGTEDGLLPDEYYRDAWWEWSQEETRHWRIKQCLPSFESLSQWTFITPFYPPSRV